MHCSIKVHLRVLLNCLLLLTFSYAVQALADGDACSGLTPTITGTEGSDAINGTEGPDVILGLGGDDVIRGNGGDDVICAGAVNNIDGGTGDDIIGSGPGTNTLDGGIGSNICDARGSDGNDVINNCETVVQTVIE